jgi:hypothetical protein
MKLYRYSETSKRVEESEAVLIDKPVEGPLRDFTPYGPNVYQVTMHATVETASLNWLLLKWDYTPSGALEKYIEQEQSKVLTVSDNLAQVKSLRSAYKSVEAL